MNEVEVPIIKIVYYMYYDMYILYEHMFVQPYICEFEFRSWRGVLDTTLCDKVCQWLTGQWFSPCTPVSSTKKTDHRDIVESDVKHHNPKLPDLYNCTPDSSWDIMSYIFDYMYFEVKKIFDFDPDALNLNDIQLMWYFNCSHKFGVPIFSV